MFASKSADKDLKAGYIAMSNHCADRGKQPVEYWVETKKNRKAESTSATESAVGF
jgi:hypothetical protein